MKIAQYMTINPVTVLKDVKLSVAKEIMDNEGFSTLPVLSLDGDLVGVITKSDIYRVESRSEELTVAEAMTSEVITVSPDQTIEEAAKLLIDNGISCLPVLSEGKLIGIVTKGNIFRVILELFGARHYGVRVSFTLPDEPGSLAAVAAALAASGADIVSVGTIRNSSRVGQVNLKVQGLSSSRVKEILSPFIVSIVDIREV